MPITAFLFNTDNGVIYEAVQGSYQIMDATARRIFTQADGSQIMLFEFTQLTFSGIDVKVTGSGARRQFWPLATSSN